MLLDDIISRKNGALEELTEQISLKRHESENNKLNIIKNSIFPKIEKLVTIVGTRKEKYANLIKQELLNLYDRKELYAINKIKFTPREVEITNMIGNRLSNRKIAKSLNLSVRTVEAFRRNIRSKLGLKDTKINLVTYLNSS